MLRLDNGAMVDPRRLSIRRALRRSKRMIGLPRRHPRRAAADPRRPPPGTDSLRIDHDVRDGSDWRGRAGAGSSARLVATGVDIAYSGRNRRRARPRRQKRSPARRVAGSTAVRPLAEREMRKTSSAGWVRRGPRPTGLCRRSSSRPPPPTLRRDDRRRHRAAQSPARGLSRIGIRSVRCWARSAR